MSRLMEAIERVEGRQEAQMEGIRDTVRAEGGQHEFDRDTLQDTTRGTLLSGLDATPEELAEAGEHLAGRGMHGAVATFALVQQGLVPFEDWIESILTLSVEIGMAVGMEAGK